MDNISYNNEDVARLFREHDDIGTDSSLWLRPLLQLLKDGKPVGKVAALTVSPMKQQKLPFGMLTQTEKNRLIFWPILPPGVNMICAGETVKVFDHITLEFPSEKIHMTAYDANSQPIHVARAWGTHHFSDYDLSLWFTLLVRISILYQQDIAVQRRVKMPTNDKERRTNEFVRYAQNISLFNVPLPYSESECDYIYFGFYLAPDSIKIDQLSPSILPVGSSMDSQIEGWPVGSIFQIAVSRLTFCQRTICVATACPPGRLRSDVFVGFPRRITS
jgi:hypothetical protein